MSRHTRTSPVAQEYHCCDVCRQEIEDVAAHQLQAQRACMGCGIDLCGGCLVVWKRDPFSGNQYATTSPLPVVCRDCDVLSLPYIRRAQVDRTKASELRQSWQGDCWADRRMPRCQA